MRTTLLITAVAVLSVGCGVTEAEINDVGGDLSAAQGELGTTTRSFVVFRKDQRRCVSPMCGGYYVHDVNRSTVREVYVNGFDFTQSNLLMPEHQADVFNAGDFEVVLFGKLGPTEPQFNTRPFIVTSAWRGMPLVKFSETTHAFFRVQPFDVRCFAAPCPTLQATKLHSSSKQPFHDVNVGPAALTAVDQNWLMDRVVQKDALVAGRFVDGAQVGTGREKVLEAAQVFVKLPDMTQSCPRPAIAQCPAGKVNLWTRNENRCLMPAGCGGGGACAAVVPSCTDGYLLTSWTGGPFGCTRYACDPAWLTD